MTRYELYFDLASTNINSILNIFESVFILNGKCYVDSDLNKREIVEKIKNELSDDDQFILKESNMKCLLIDNKQGGGGHLNE